MNDRGDSNPEKLASLGILVAFQVCSETMSPEAVEYAVDTFCTSVERENGRPLVVMGGEVLALFGLGGIREREVERAVDASLFVLDTLQRGLPGMEASPSFPVRIVVELGPIQTEGVGFAWGAARIGGSGIQDVRTLLRANGEGGVFVGKNAWREVRTLYDSETSGNTHRLKNRRRVAILREASFVGGQEVSLVGRDYELQHLERAFKRVVQRGRLVAVPVLGLPGMGKSRLLSEFLGRLNERSEGCTVDVTRCIPSSEGVPFAPFRRSFRTRYPLYDEEDQDTVNALLRHLPGIRELPDDVALLRVQRLSALLGLGGGEEDETWHSPSDPSQELAFEAYSHYIQALAREIPYVLVVDDMQWIRPSSMKLLSYLSQRCIDSPVLLLMTLRERDAERVLSSVDLPASALTSLELEPLAVPDVGDLVTTLFGEGVLDKRMLQTLHDLTNGLPQELEEHLEALVESGALRKEATRWVYRPAEPVTAAELPRSLSELVHQRLARLGPDEQRLLRAGALAGATFSSELLSAMVDRTVVDVEIDELVQEGWWMESKVGDFPRSRELSFRQDRVRDAILELLSEENSRGLHLKAAAWLDSVAVDVNPSARTARLARHYTEAGAREQGAVFTVARAREYVAAFAGTEAFDAFGEAIDMALPNQSEEVAENEELLREALIGRIRWGWVLGKHEDVFAAVNQAESAGLSRDSVENQAFWIDVDHLLGEILTVEGKYDRAIQFMERALLASESSDCLDRSAEIRGRICSVSLFEHRFEESERQASQLLKEVPNPPKPAWCRAAASALGALARIAMHNEDYDSSLTLIRRGAEYRSLAGDSVGHQMARIAEANTYFFMGNLEKAVDAYREVSHELRNLGFRIGASQAECNLAETLLNLGKPKEALELLDGEVERNFRSLKAVPSLVEALRVRGEVFLRLNRSGEAIAPLREALELADEHNLERAKKPLEELLERVRTAV